MTWLHRHAVSIAIVLSTCAVEAALILRGFA